MREAVINIPPGVDSGERLRVAGKGHAGVNGGRYGDLYINIQVAPPTAAEAMFKRKGADLNVEVFESY
jgi:DnaJ-class molecular chaperone